MKFVVDQKIFEKFPGLTIGVLVAKNVDNSGAAQEIQTDLKKAGEEIRSKYSTETLSQLPKIDCWRKAYAAFGGKPKENRSSVENLHRMVLQGKELRPISPLVDAYNLVSLKHMLPLGGEDLDKVTGDIQLTFAGESEPSVMLLGDREARPPHAGEVIYKDDVSAICRRFNWREADRTKLMSETKNCVLVVEGLPPSTAKEVESAVLELKELVQTFCKGDLAYAILDEKNKEMEL